MEAYGYSDWEGNDRHFMGWAGTGVAFDPVIADSAAAWLRANAASSQPWFLTVALVNPHDVMWFPIDQPRVAFAASRRARDGAGAARVVAMEGRRDAAGVRARLPVGRRHAARELPRRPLHEARRPSGVALVAAARHLGLHRPVRQGGVAPPSRLLRRVAPVGRRVARRRACRRSSRRARGTTPRSSSPPTTATCAARTGCGRRARSCTTRSCGSRCTSACRV